MDAQPSPSQLQKGKVVDSDGKAIDAATMRKQWEKIQQLEQKLGEAGKKEQAMANEMQDHRMKMEAVLSRARQLEEEKQNVTLDYDLKNKRGLGSQMTS